MKKEQKAKKNFEVLTKITLKGYTESLSAKSPRQQLIDRLVERCGVSEATVRNWLFYDKKPQSYKHVKIIMEETGIAEEDLWKE